MDLSDLIVFTATGTIDTDKSLAAFKVAFDAHNARHEQESAVLATAINAVFDTWKGQRIGMPQLTAYVIGNLNLSPDVAKKIGVKVRDFIKANSSVYSSGKGLRGVARICDIPVKALKAPKTERASKKGAKAETVA
jgi:hypothetical protein